MVHLNLTPASKPHAQKDVGDISKKVISLAQHLEERMSQLGSFHSSEQQFRGTKLGRTLPTLLHSWVFGSLWVKCLCWPILQTQTPSLPSPSGLLLHYRLKCTCQPSHCDSTFPSVSLYLKPYVFETDRRAQSPLGSADLLDWPLAKYSFLFSSILCCNNCRKDWQSKLKRT